MKNALLIPLTCMTIILSVSLTGVHAKETTDRLPEPPEPKLSIVDAAELAQKAQSGTVFSIHLDYFENQPTYIVDFEDSTSMASLMVDGMTGDIVATAIANGSSPEAVDFLLDASAHGIADDLLAEEEILLAELVMQDAFSDHMDEMCDARSGPRKNHSDE